jgi:tRNA(fMet)-specific endonuclease VapC
MTRVLLLDTNVISEILRTTPAIMQRFTKETAASTTFLMSPVVYYQLRRGLLHRSKPFLLARLDRIIAPMSWIEMTRADWEEAATLWAKTQTIGRTRGDDDIFITAQANRRGATVVTANVSHFRDIAIAMETWS